MVQHTLEKKNWLPSRDWLRKQQDFRKKDQVKVLAMVQGVNRPVGEKQVVPPGAGRKMTDLGD